MCFLFHLCSNSNPRGRTRSSEWPFCKCIYDLIWVLFIYWPVREGSKHLNERETCLWGNSSKRSLTSSLFCILKRIKESLLCLKALEGKRGPASAIISDLILQYILSKLRHFPQIGVRTDASEESKCEEIEIYGDIFVMLKGKTATHFVLAALWALPGVKKMWP